VQVHDQGPVVGDAGLRVADLGDPAEGVAATRVGQDVIELGAR
jgi:hypothetical protein